MASKGPFQPKPFYDSMISMKIEGYKQNRYAQVCISFTAKPLYFTLAVCKSRSVHVLSNRFLNTAWGYDTLQYK